jgi:glycosyltransferase involved in cell wall biosynthesis
MRIAQIAPLFESVPPQLYGGTERVVSVLTEERVSRGHDVTLFASGDSVTSATLAPCSKRSLRLEGSVTDHVALTTIELAKVFDRQDEFEMIHNHVDYFAFPFARQRRTPMITTTHGRLDLEEIRNVYDYFAEAPLVSISNAQREPLPAGRWLGTIYNGIDFSLFNLHPEPGKYLAFLGRISPEKRPDRAIEIARALEMPLKIAAKVDAIDKDYFEHVVKPHLSHPLIEFVGEVGDRDKDEFLGNAYAYLFPIDWPEPFGLTMVEAMACGTPVVATNCGSVPEVVENGVSRFICRSLRELIDSVVSARRLDRAGCRAYAEARFSASVMADGYERIYRQTVPRNDPVRAEMEGGWAALGDYRDPQDHELEAAPGRIAQAVLDHD